MDENIMSIGTRGLGQFGLGQFGLGLGLGLGCEDLDSDLDSDREDSTTSLLLFDSQMLYQLRYRGFCMVSTH